MTPAEEEAAQQAEVNRQADGCVATLLEGCGLGCIEVGISTCIVGIGLTTLLIGWPL